MRRHLLGLIALASFALAVIPYGCPPLARYQTAGDMGLRVALVLGVFWLAWPDLHRLPRWVWFALPLGLVALRYAKPVLIFLLPAFVVATAAYLLYRKVWGRSPH